MLRILYYLCTKSGKISAKKGGGLTLRHGRTLRILRYIPKHSVGVVKKRMTIIIWMAEHWKISLLAMSFRMRTVISEDTA